MIRIDKEGYKIIGKSFLVFALFTTLFFFLLPNEAAYPLSVIIFLLFLFIVRFFRVPEREQLLNAKAIYSPADGTVVVSEKVFVEEYFNCEMVQISVFMSIWNVHANWFPVSGVVNYFRHHNGDFKVAWHPKSSTENERTTTVVTTPQGQTIMFRQIAGSLAKRIVSCAVEGESYTQNSRCGFIKFGSRLDIFVPLETKINVKLGDKVVGSQSIIAFFSQVD